MSTATPTRPPRPSRPLPARPSRPAPPKRPRGRRLRRGNPRRRLHAALIAVAIVLTLFAGRLLEMQAVRGQDLADSAAASRTRTDTLVATRGPIVDRDGQRLAMNVRTRNVTVDQTLVVDPRATAAALSPLLGAEPATLAARLTGEKRFAYLAKGISPSVWTQIAALRLPGIYSENATRRVYPSGAVGANVIGFVGGDGHGLGGLEYGLDDELAGVDGERTYQGALAGRRIEIPTGEGTITDAVPGVGLQLTLDRDIQWVAQRAIAQAVKAAKADSGDVVVMDPRTGQILAMASAPTFDPNKPAETAVADRGNRALSDVFEPGSTSKIMTVAAAIDQGTVTPSTRFTVPPVLEWAGKDNGGFHDSEDHGELKLTLNGVLARSSNIGAIMTARTIGADTLYSYLKRFGVGEATGLDFPGESKGFVPPPSQWSGTTLPTLAFGQGLSVNSVQAASIYATIANDGVRVQPSLVAGTIGDDGTVTPAAAPTTTKVVSPQTAQTMRKMLESVVSDEGTAPMAQIPGYRVAGKTGTAFRIDPDGSGYQGYVSSFIGMAPADAPGLVVAVNVNNPRVGHYGGVLAGPVFKQVMSFALGHLQIQPTGTASPKLKTTWK